MDSTRYNDSELWDISFLIAVKICDEAKDQNLDINNVIYAFKILVPAYTLETENWNEVISLITIAVYKLSLYYISQNIHSIIKSKATLQ